MYCCQDLGRVCDYVGRDEDRAVSGPWRPIYMSPWHRAIHTQYRIHTYLSTCYKCWRQLAVIHLGPESDALMILCFVPCDVKYPDTDLLWVTNFNHNFASTPTSKFAIICTGLKLQIILFICVLMYWILTVLKTLCTYIYQVYPLPARKMIWKGFIHVYLIIVEIVPMRPFNQSFIH